MDLLNNCRVIIYLRLTCRAVADHIKIRIKVAFRLPDQHVRTDPAEFRMSKLWIGGPPVRTYERNTRLGSRYNYVKTARIMIIIFALQTLRGRSNIGAMDLELEVHRHEAWEELFERHVKGAGEQWERSGSDRKILECKAW